MKGNLKKTYNLLTMSMMLMLVVIVVFVVSCAKDDDIHNGRTVLYPEFVNNSMVNASTKALTQAEEDTYHNNLASATRVFAYAVNKDPGAESHGKQPIISGRFTKKSGTIIAGDAEWNSNLEIENAFYDIYGLGTYGIGNITNVTHTATASGTTLGAVISGISVATQYDPTVSVAAAKKTSDESTIEQDLTLGSFEFDNTTGNENKVYMAMKHLYAQANILFKSDPVYNELRTIEITGVSVSSQDKTGLTFSFSSDALPTATWTTPLTTGTEDSFDLPHKKLTVSAGVQSMEDITYPIVLNPTTAKEAGSFRFVPLLKTIDGVQLIPVSITVSYNIYRYELDEHDEPYTDQAHFIRSSSATNSRILTFVDPQRNINRGAPAQGNNYNITIKVAPTYLYVLADDDADFKLELEE